MKPSTILFWVLGAIGALVVMVVIAVMYRSGSPGLPAWRSAAIPGPLSASHAFLETRCENCHTPNQGVAAASCLTCHATAAAELLPQSATAFHANIGQCAGCHVEHLGRARRPVNMDHATLVAAGHAHAIQAAGDGQGGSGSSFRHQLLRLKALLDGSGADVVGGPLNRRQLPPGMAATLDCAGCHVARDPHQSLFGRDCQGCHRTDTWSVAAFRHPSPRSPDCGQCHQAPPSHFMMHFEMMDRGITGQHQANVEQCQLCHRTDSWNNIRGAGWVDMH